MKKILSFTIALFTTALAALAEGPVPSFSETSHDFGNIKEANGPVTYEFEFTNTGDEPLVIVSANASCGCTKPEIPKKPIPAGKSAKIKVIYLPKGRPGEFNKTVRVRTNAPRPHKQVNLKINGVVIPDTNGK
ncbi:MAG: DUF1573 domain-containing protein [Muribaculaceae bacterium]|nr:DUF1573 domain-containing protein [Muribaculaceae bacterium]